MSLDDSPADRQAYSHAVGLRGEEGFKDLLDVILIYSGSRILHQYRDTVRF